MSISALAYNISLRDAKLLRQMCKLVTDSEIEVIDLNLFSFEPNVNTVCIACGEKAYRHVKKESVKLIVQLPEIKFLHKDPANTKSRENAVACLTQLKQQLVSPIPKHKESVKFDSVDFEALTKKIALKEFENYMEEHGVDHVLYKLKDGETLSISSSPRSHGDVNLTFTELAALFYSVHSLFKVDSLQIVYKDA